MEVKQPNPDPAPSSARHELTELTKRRNLARIRLRSAGPESFSTINTNRYPLQPTMKSNPIKKPLCTRLAIVLLALGTMLGTSCTTREKATFWGAAGGAAGGALIAGDGNRAGGAIIGGILGAGAGNLFGRGKSRYR
jgi:hypothetical protein